LILVTACSNGTQEAEELPDWSAGIENGTSVATTNNPTEPQPEPEDYEFNIHLADEVLWPARMRAWDPNTGEIFPDKACGLDLEFAVAGSAAQSKHCIIEQNEGDVHLHPGVQIAAHVPPDTCDYLLTRFYMYQAWEVGYGNNQISYDISGSDILNPVGVDSSGSPICDFNYEPVGPNCCVGAYALTVTDLATGEAEVTQGLWGGNGSIGKCYDGAGYVYDEVEKSSNLLPLDPYFYLDGSALDVTFRFSELYEKKDSNDFYYTTNIALSNYIDLADHGGELPIGLNPDADTLGFVNPYYEFICADHALEKFAVIYLTVREWNTEAEFALDIDGNPNAGEDELENLESWQDYNDHMDWRDFGQTPGFIGFWD
jgi:hypothetical protein